MAMIKIYNVKLTAFMYKGRLYFIYFIYLVQKILVKDMPTEVKIPVYPSGINKKCKTPANPNTQN